MNPLDAIEVRIPWLEDAEEETGDGVRVWHTPDGDRVSLHYFATAPNLPGDLDSIADLRLAISRHVAASGGAVVEADVTSVDGRGALRQCLKFPQEPSGMTYLASMTLPFRVFSYVLKVQCGESGMTGMREAMVLSEKLDCGEVQAQPDDGSIVGWMRDPYDASRTSRLARTLADDAEHDARFADHPLSRVLKAVEASVHLRSSIKSAPAFVYRTNAPK